jgi:hypothetical protein
MQAVRFPIVYRAGTEWAVLQIQRLVSVVRLLQLSSHVNAHDGNTQQALDDILGLFAALEALRAEPSQISLFVRTAVHVTGCGAVQQFIGQSGWGQLATLQQAGRGVDFKRE